MFSNIFRKNEAPASVALDLQAAKVATEALLATQEANQLAIKVEWEGKLQSAIGNDHELLAVAKDAPSVDIKHAAVLALKSEAALKLAEREFRTHDRRIHRLAKQRYEALVAKRETCEAASQLIDNATALVNEAIIPANRLVELDLAWRALDPALLDDEQNATFAQLQKKLTALIRERSDSLRAVQRWTSEARQALTQLNAAGAGISADNKEWAALASAIASASDSARTTVLAVPVTLADKDSMAELVDALQAALHKADQISVRLSILDALYQGEHSGHAESSQTADSAVATVTPSQRWQALPPLADAHLDKLLNAYFEGWGRSQTDARKSRQAEGKQRASEKSKAAQQAHDAALEVIVKKAEAAIAAGHLAETNKHLVAIQEDQGSKTANGDLHIRIHAVQAEYARLKGWQHWGGGLVRDDLVLEAEALAKATVGEEGQPQAKLILKQHAETIEKLRTGWKELDRLGGATSRELWQRFDEALKTAYQPVAAHLDKLNTERQNNLSARKQLLATLDAVNVAQGEDSNEPDWRGIARALELFQTEWRKLGPIEHTVPHKSRDDLLEQMKACIASLENPLLEMRGAAQATREEFIVRAKALSADAQGRDVIAKVRAVQAEWQTHSKSQPLLRNVENVLWAEFKTAIDAVFSLRDAASTAKEAELKANQAAREALIARVGELTQDTPPADIKRTLAAVEMEWRKAGDPPRNAVEKLNEKFRSACQTALQYIAGSSQRIWNVTWDSLSKKLALCEEQEASAEPWLDSDARWSALPVLPTVWEQALHQRFKVDEIKPTGVSFDVVLLQMESALEMESPPAFQDARRTLKLSMMKSAMEGRDAPSLAKNGSAKNGIEGLLASALGYAHISPVQHERLDAILAILRAGAFEVHGDKVRSRSRS